MKRWATSFCVIAATALGCSQLAGLDDGDIKLADDRDGTTEGSASADGSLDGDAHATNDLDATSEGSADADASDDVRLDAPTDSDAPTDLDAPTDSDAPTEEPPPTDASDDGDSQNADERYDASDPLPDGPSIQDAGPEAIASDGAPVATPAPDFAWYRLDETSGATAHDSSPNHYDITNLNGVVWGAGATFDGASVCGTTDVGQAFRSPPITMTLWIRASSRNDETAATDGLMPFPPNAFSGDPWGNGGFGVGLNVWTDGTPGNGMALQTGQNAAIAFNTVNGFSPDVEYFAALAIGDANTADLYVDGVWRATVAANLPGPTTPAPLHLGCHNDDPAYSTKRFFKGRIRDARIYTRVLGSSEIAQLFANGPV